jgi:hypothetical protein
MDGFSVDTSKSKIWRLLSEIVTSDALDGRTKIFSARLKNVIASQDVK